MTVYVIKPMTASRLSADAPHCDEAGKAIVRLIYTPDHKTNDAPVSLHHRKLDKASWRFSPFLRRSVRHFLPLFSLQAFYSALRLRGPFPIFCIFYSTQDLVSGWLGLQDLSLFSYRAENTHCSIDGICSDARRPFVYALGSQSEAFQGRTRYKFSFSPRLLITGGTITHGL